MLARRLLRERGARDAGTAEPPSDGLAVASGVGAAGLHQLVDLALRLDPVFQLAACGEPPPLGA